MTRRVAAALLALLAGVATPAPAQAADPTVGAPVVGQCSDLAPADRDADTWAGAPVDCAGPHTAQVVAVAVLPDRLGYDSPGLEVFALRTCYAGQEQALGAGLRRARLTAYDVAWFVPDAAQQAAGARWLRCDLVLPTGRRLAPLPARPALGARPDADEVARCLAGRQQRVVTCSARHALRVSASVMAPGRRYRDAEGWTDLGRERCPRATGARSFVLAWPSRVAWRAGDRALLCFAPDGAGSADRTGRG